MTNQVIHIKISEKTPQWALNLILDMVKLNPHYLGVSLNGKELFKESKIND